MSCKRETRVARPGLVMWAGTLRASSLPERVEAAAAVGCTSLSLSPHDYQQARSKGLSDPDIRLLVADSGLEVNCFDPFTRWLTAWEPPSGYSKQMIAFLDVSEALIFRGAEAVGARSVTVLEPFGVRWPDEVFATSLNAVARRAADSGIRVNVEFVPFLGIPNLAGAWRIVQLAASAGAGIVLDTWHYIRGDPDDALLMAIPGERIGAVQVSDAAARPVGDLETDCLHHRLPAGKGAFPLARVLDKLRSTGGLHDVGPEVFSDAFDRQPALVTARAAAYGPDVWLDGAGPPVTAKPSEA